VFKVLRGELLDDGIIAGQPDNARDWLSEVCVGQIKVVKLVSLKETYFVGRTVVLNLGLVSYICR
jgi:hypothetical protein